MANIDAKKIEELCYRLEGRVNDTDAPGADYDALTAAELLRGYLATPSLAGEDVSPEDRAEQFIQAAVDSAPEPLRRLGEWLANKLDEDDWKTAERMLLGAAMEARSAEPARALEEAKAIMRGFLQCPEIADCDPRDLDQETRQLDRRARAALGAPNA